MSHLKNESSTESATDSSTAPSKSAHPLTIKAVLKTNKGTISLNLFAQQAPVTVANFINLAQKGFYNSIEFHRVIDDFMIQTGCPMGTGMGDPGYRFEDECCSELRHDSPGILSMANSGPGTNGSQFFITHTQTPWLDGKHTVFGKVVGDDDQVVVHSIRQHDVMESVQIEGDVNQLLDSVSDRLPEWNSVLADMFPNLSDVS